MPKSSRSAKILTWLETAGHGQSKFSGVSDHPLLQAFEVRLSAEAKGETERDGGKSFFLVFGGEPSGLEIGEKGNAIEFQGVRGGPSLVAPKNPNAMGKAKPERCPIFANDFRAIYGIASSGAVVEETRSAKSGGNRVMAKDLDQFLERAVRLERSRTPAIRWSLPKGALLETPVAQASGDDETWWDGAGWTARRDSSELTVWFEDSAAADRFFATPRPEGTLWSAEKYRRPKPGEVRAPYTPKPLAGQLDKLLPKKILDALRERGALFDPPREDKSRTPLAKLMAAQKIEMNAAAEALDRSFAGLSLPDEEDYLAIGVRDILEAEGEPWPHKKAPKAGKEPLVPFGVFDQGTRHTLWIDARGTIYCYSNEESRFIKLAASIEKMFEVLFFD